MIRLQPAAVAEQLFVRISIRMCDPSLGELATDASCQLIAAYRHFTQKSHSGPIAWRYIVVMYLLASWCGVAGPSCIQYETKFKEASLEYF